MPEMAGIGVAHACADRQTRSARGAAARNAAVIQAGLARIVEDEILPRLTLAHQADPPSRASTTRSPMPDRVAALARALMAGDSHGAWVRAILEEGLSLDALLLDLFAPAARYLGALWEDDAADFLDVAVALGRLQNLTRALCADLEGVDVTANGRRVLLMPCPGEAHLFSLALVASFFREAGWHVVLTDGADEDPASLLRAERFDLVGISLSCDVLLPVMAESVATLRAASCNRDLRVIVGGPLFVREPACASFVGADAVAADAQSAVKIAEAALAR